MKSKNMKHIESVICKAHGLGICDTYGESVKILEGCVIVMQVTRLLRCFKQERGCRRVFRRYSDGFKSFNE